MENWIQQLKNSFLWNCGSSHWTLGTLERQSLTFTIDSLGNWSSNPVFVKISSSISMDLKNIWKMEFYFNKFKSIRWFCTNKRESSKHMWKFSIQSIGKHINRGSLHSSHKHCFSIWKWRIFWMLEKFKLNCLYVLINFFFSFLFNSFVDFAIKLIVQNNNCFQNKQMFQPKFFSFRKFVLFIQLFFFLGFKNFWKKIENFSIFKKFLEKKSKKLTFLCSIFGGITQKWRFLRYITHIFDCFLGYITQNKPFFVV